MLPNVAVFASLLLASIVRATPSIFHRQTGIGSFDGGVSVYPPKLVLSVFGNITVPMTLTGDEGSEVYFSIGLDSFPNNCTNSSFGVGIYGTINGTGQPSYNVIYHDPRFGADDWIVFDSNVSPGDDIAMAVFINPDNKTSGFGTISNVNKAIVHNVNFTTDGSPPLCSKSGGWFIQINQAGNRTVDFGTLDFQYAEVNTSAGMYYPSDSSSTYTLNMTDGNDVLYAFKTNGTTVTAQRPPSL